MNTTAFCEIKHTKDSNNKPIIKPYRRGFYYQLNQSPLLESDYIGENNGPEYPSLLFGLDVSARQAKDTRKITERAQMVLSDLMNINNNGQVRTRTEMEVRADLMDIWQRLILEYGEMVKLTQQDNLTNNFPIIASDFEITFGYSQNQDVLLNMYIAFDLEYQIPCVIQPNFDYNAAKADTNLPFPDLGRFDYSNPFYKNDRNPPV
jgi:hypothetical protein